MALAEANVDCGVQFHRHDAGDTEGSFKIKTHKKGYCPYHPDVQIIRKNSIFSQAETIPCPRCAELHDVKVKQMKSGLTSPPQGVSVKPVGSGGSYSAVDREETPRFKEKQGLKDGVFRGSGKVWGENWLLGGGRFQDYEVNVQINYPKVTIDVEWSAGKVKWSTIFFSKRDANILGLKQNKGTSSEDTVTLRSCEVDFDTDIIAVNFHVVGVSSRYGASFSYETTDKNGGEHVNLMWLGN